ASRAHPPLHPFPTRRSSDLSVCGSLGPGGELLSIDDPTHDLSASVHCGRGKPSFSKGTPHADRHSQILQYRQGLRLHPAGRRRQDRKSTRLNSSHVKISYAV